MAELGVTRSTSTLPCSPTHLQEEKLKVKIGWHLQQMLHWVSNTPGLIALHLFGACFALLLLGAFLLLF